MLCILIQRPGNLLNCCSKHNFRSCHIRQVAHIIKIRTRSTSKLSFISTLCGWSPACAGRSPSMTSIRFAINFITSLFIDESFGSHTGRYRFWSFLTQRSVVRKSISFNPSMNHCWAYGIYEVKSGIFTYPGFRSAAANLGTPNTRKHL